MSGRHRTTEIGKHRSIPVPHRNRAAVVTGVTLAAGGMLASTAAGFPAGPEWSPIIACESGGDPQAQNPGSTASGLFQFLDTSWAAYGGSKYGARAKDATAAQQTEIANRAYALSGLSPWAASKGCWAGKVSTAAPTRHAVTTDRSAPPRHAAPPVVVKPALPSAPISIVPAPSVTIGPTVDYTVAAGDTLAQIATARNAPGGWSQLAGLNGLTDPDTLTVGQHLKVPAPPTAIVPPVTAGIMNMTADVATALLGQPVGVALPVPPPAAVATVAQTSAPVVAPAAFTVKASGTTGGLAARAVSAAIGQVGTAYVYGGNTPGKALDCSSLVQFAFRQAGIALPRTAAAQAAMGKTVQLSDVRAGDLLFFYAPISHVAMAAGNGMVIEASQPGHPVALRPMYTNGLSVIKRIV